MQKYQHIFWDLDHTLWDFEKNSSLTLQVLFEHFQLHQRGITSFEPFRVIYEMHNETLWDALIAGTIDRVTLRWKRMDLTLQNYNIQDLDLAHAMSEKYLEILPTQGQLMPFAKEILEYCSSKHYAMHIITNGFEKTQWQKMRTSKIEGFFQGVFTSENTQSLKPHAPIFNAALNGANAKASESIMIGDAILADIEGAQNIGMDQIWYNYLQQQSNTKPTYEINSLSEIMNIL